jgi:hypothetical protein
MRELTVCSGDNGPLVELICLSVSRSRGGGLMQAYPG